MGPFAVEREVVVDWCSACSLAWCDRGELSRLTGHPDDLLDPWEPPPDDGGSAVAFDAKPCPSCAGIVLDRVPFARPLGPWIERCPYCEGTLIALAQLPPLREAVKRRRAPPPKRPERVAFDPDAPTWAPMSLRRAALAVPVALLVAAVFRKLTLTSMLLGGFRVSLHELGHASAAWACSWMAVPLPIGLTLWLPGRSWIAFGGLLLAQGLLAWLGLRRGVWMPVVAAGAFFALTCAGTFGLDRTTQEMVITWAGCAGEMVWATVLILAFHHPLPPHARWDFFRWIALGLGAYALVDAVIFWQDCAADWSKIPWGSLFGGDEEGDLTKLRDVHHWDEPRITGRYVMVARVCMALIAGWYAAHLAGAWRRERTSGRDRA